MSDAARLRGTAGLTSTKPANSYKLEVGGMFDQDILFYMLTSVYVGGNASLSIP